MRRILIISLMLLLTSTLRVNAREPDQEPGGEVEFKDVINMAGNFELDTNSDGLADGWNITSNVSSKYRSALSTNVIDGSYAQTLTSISSSGVTYMMYKDIFNSTSIGDLLYIQYNANEYPNSCNEGTELKLTIGEYGSFNAKLYLGKIDLTQSKQLQKYTYEIPDITGEDFRLYFSLYNENGLNNGCHISLDGVYIFNLTELFGAGNEPNKVPMQTIVNNHTSNTTNVTNKLYEGLGDFEVDDDSNGLGAYWKKTSQVEETYISDSVLNVHTGTYSQRLQFNGGNTDNQGISINIFSAGNPNDEYFYYYTTRERTGYCNSNTYQRIRIYDYDSYDNGSTINSTNSSDTNTLKSGIFTTSKSNFRFALTIIDYSGIKDGCQIYYDSVILINLTEMFGKGFEPTSSEMNLMFGPNNYDSSECDYLNAGNSVTIFNNLSYRIMTQYDSEAENAIAEWENMGIINLSETVLFETPEVEIRDCPDHSCTSGTNWMGVYVHPLFGIDKIYLNNINLLNSSTETITYVISHELGHALSLSHNISRNVLNQHPDGNNRINPGDMDVACYNKKWNTEEE